MEVAAGQRSRTRRPTVHPRVRGKLPKVVAARGWLQSEHALASRDRVRTSQGPLREGNRRRPSGPRWWSQGPGGYGGWLPETLRKSAACSHRNYGHHLLGTHRRGEGRRGHPGNQPDKRAGNESGNGGYVVAAVAPHPLPHGTGRRRAQTAAATPAAISVPVPIRVYSARRRGPASAPPSRKCLRVCEVMSAWSAVAALGNAPISCS